MGEMLQDLCENFSKPLERVYWEKIGGTRTKRGDGGGGEAKLGAFWEVDNKRQDDAFEFQVPLAVLYHVAHLYLEQP